jgi:hypothetical protein
MEINEMTAIAIGLLIGIIIAVGTIMPTKKFLRPRNEKAFYSLTLFPIALIYIGFSYYYGNLSALHAETVGVIIFLFLALLGQLMSSWILIYAYIIHAAWDVLHEIFVAGITHKIPWTEVPAGYASFCLAYDLIIAFYIYKRIRLWEDDEKA